MENTKDPISTPNNTFLPKNSTAAVAKPIAGKKGSILILVTNISRDNLAIRKYSTAVITTILVVEFKNVGTLYCLLFVLSPIISVLKISLSYYCKP